MTHWSPIGGYEGLYEISDDGQVMSFVVSSDGRIMNPTPNKQGYLHLNLTKDNSPTTFYIHQLVADAFLERPVDGVEVRHYDDNKSNNTVENLIWGTSSDNKLDLVRNGKHHYASRDTCRFGGKLDVIGKSRRRCSACAKATQQKNYLKRSKGIVLTDLEYLELHADKLKEVSNE